MTENPNRAAFDLPQPRQVTDIDRPLTVSEYYHAAIGCHPQSHIRSREVAIVLEGAGDIDAAAWRTALDLAAAANPGARLRLVGKRQNARWVSDAQPPPLRIVDACTWDGRSSEGADAVFATKLALEQGRTAELIVARDAQRAGATKVIFRVSHAVMDGVGTLHFLQELFRALRGETLLGTNATYTDTDLMRNGPRRTVRPRDFKPASMMGGAQGDERGGIWRRFSLDGPQPNLLPRVVAAMTEYSRRNSELPTRIGIPANLRRHVPDLLATTNFTGMTYLDLDAADAIGIDDIKADLKVLRDGNADMSYRKIFEIMRYLPFAWVDGMLSVNEKNYRAPHLHESAVLTVLGSFKKTLFSGGGFAAERMYALPQLENVFVSVAGLQGNFEICVGMPRIFACNGRMEQFLDFLFERLSGSRGAVES